jgi:hypothetical protein
VIFPQLPPAWQQYIPLRSDSSLRTDCHHCCVSSPIAPDVSKANGTFTKGSPPCPAISNCLRYPCIFRTCASVAAFRGTLWLLSRKLDLDVGSVTTTSNACATPPSLAEAGTNTSAGRCWPSDFNCENRPATSTSVATLSSILYIRWMTSLTASWHNPLCAFLHTVIQCLPFCIALDRVASSPHLHCVINSADFNNNPNLIWSMTANTLEAHTNLLSIGIQFNQVPAPN